MGYPAKTTQITLGEFIDNIEKNGLPQARSYLFDLGADEATNEKPYHGMISAACAFGQGLINSNAYIDLDASQVEDLGFEIEEGDFEFMDVLYRQVWNMNDNPPYNNIREIVQWLRDTYRGQLDKVLTFEYFDYSPYLAAGVK